MKPETSLLRAANAALLLLLSFAAGSARAEGPLHAPAAALPNDAAAPPSSAAEAPAPDARADSATHEIGWKDVALFAGGAATAFVAHEAGHTVANLSMGNVPHLESVRFLGFVPFFAVSPEITCLNSGCFKSDGSRFGPGKRGLLLILMAGFDVQHITDEVLLTGDPALRLHHAPFRTGLLAFNTLTSLGYAIANLGGFEPPAGDLQAAFRDTGAPRLWTTGLLVGIAGLDVARWALPDVPWIAWVSRAAKVAFLGLPIEI
jgi:hypothetical protein